MAILIDDPLTKMRKKESDEALAKFNRITDSYGVAEMRANANNPELVSLAKKIIDNPYNNQLIKLEERARDVTARTMKLWGHFASPMCKYEECRTPTTDDLIFTFNKISSYLQENCIFLGTTDSSKTDIKPLNANDVNYWNTASFRAARLFKKEIEDKPYWMLQHNSLIQAPHTAITVVGKDSDLSDKILDELSITNFVYLTNTRTCPGWTKYESYTLSFETRNELITQLIEKSEYMCPYNGYKPY